MPDHPELYHREIVSAADADALGIRTSSVLWEKIGVGGAVLPHYHDVAEIIHITAGKVKLLCNGEWRSYQAGDTFQVPAGVVHSVMNDDTVPTEQISIFLPVENEVPRNRFFATTLVPVPLPVRQARDAEEDGAGRISGGIEAGSSDVGACGAKESE
ncbi:cupin domain-containing protein [Paenibacillus athensensis]|uniref:Cupin n=2 Tax=Paenibacillus athensensis TaxID=1967502 RepID=A0A4Y8PZI1_9BACL|nr:cupin domain-containing protein [Paenibacillus athensensis]